MIGRKESEFGRRAESDDFPARVPAAAFATYAMQAAQALLRVRRTLGIVNDRTPAAPTVPPTTRATDDERWEAGMPVLDRQPVTTPGAFADGLRYQ